MNVNKTCTGCQKTVYPMEQLKCLDQYWHKTCFKCEVCKTTLNMKNYKGFEKKPYCHAHYPTVKHTPVSDTPELKRVMENSKKVSQVSYHQAFEKSKGQKISVVDDPLSTLQKKTQQNVSQVAYHNLRDKRLSMEARRSSVEAIQGRQDSNGADAPVSIPAPPPPTNSGSSQTVGDRASFYSRAAAGFTFTKPQSSSVVVTHQSKRFQPGRIEDYDPLNEQYGSVSRPSGSTEQARGPRPSSFQGDVVEETMPAPVNSLRSPTRHESSSGPYSPPISSPVTYVPSVLPSPPAPESPPTPESPPASLEVKLAPQPESPPQTSPYEQEFESAEPEPALVVAEPAPVTEPIYEVEENGRAASGGLPDGVAFGKPPLYRAAYEYASQDCDEVSFVEGDIISNGLPIDEGWMYGMVERTGAYGMMPSNYVTPL